MGLLQQFNYNNKNSIVTVSCWHTAVTGFTQAMYTKVVVVVLPPCIQVLVEQRDRGCAQ